MSSDRPPTQMIRSLWGPAPQATFSRLLCDPHGQMIRSLWGPAPQATFSRLLCDPHGREEALRYE